MPIRPADGRHAALERSGEFANERITYLWDGEFAAARSWQKTLGLPGVAWDVYLLYRPQAKWKSRPPRPDFWMHQLRTAEGKAPFLDEGELAEAVRELLAKAR